MSTIQFFSTIRETQKVIRKNDESRKKNQHRTTKQSL